VGLAALLVAVPSRAVPTQWLGATGDVPLVVTVVSAPTNVPSSGLPVIFYLKNLAAPRVGTEPDAPILRDFGAAGYLVLTLDFAGRTNARVPFINRDLGKLRDDLFRKKFLGEYRLDDAHIFIVPEGCRLKRDVEFHREGSRAWALDIIYPSRPRKPVGALLEFSCDNRQRFSNGSLAICSDTLLDAFATEGFAVAMADHPVAGQYRGMDPMPDSARKLKAAVRTLRAEGGALGLNGRIVPVGFSRASGMALMLATTDGMPEFEGFGAHTNVSSAVQGAIVMSGRFTYLDLLADDKMVSRYTKAWGDRATNEVVWRRHGALDYLAKPTAPLFLSINEDESAEALHQMAVLRQRLAAIGNEFSFKLDRAPRGHKVTLDPEILGEMRDYLKQRFGYPADASAAVSPRYKVAVSDLMILKRQKLGALQLAKDLDADGVEVDLGGLGDRETFDNQLTNATTRQAFLGKAGELGLEIPSLAMTGFFAQSFAERPTVPRMIQDCVDTMTAMQVKVAFLPLGVKGDLVKNPELRPAMVERLRMAGVIAAQAGVVIGVETSLPATEEVKLLNEVGSPAIKIYFNFANAVKHGRDIPTELRTLGQDRLCQIHATNEDGVWLENDPAIDLPRIKQTLDELGWSGWLVVERSRDAKDPKNVRGNFGANVRYLKKVFQSP
jgi:L-ribulose-5-phosphate 3-epimerase